VPVCPGPKHGSVLREYQRKNIWSNLKGESSAPIKEAYWIRSPRGNPGGGATYQSGFAPGTNCEGVVSKLGTRAWSVRKLKEEERIKGKKERGRRQTVSEAKGDSVWGTWMTRCVPSSAGRVGGEVSGGSYGSACLRDRLRG